MFFCITRTFLAFLFSVPYVNIYILLEALENFSVHAQGWPEKQL